MCYIDPLYNMYKTLVPPRERCNFSDVSSLAKGFPPDGLLTSELAKHDVNLNPHIIEPDPFASDDRLNDFTTVHPFLLNKIEEENTMNQGADELSSGLNGRLRPRKSNIPSPQTTKPVRKSDGKTGQDKVKRTSTVSKTPPNKTDDLSIKSDSTFFCPYCDKHFASKQTLSKHVRRIHTASSKQDSFIACLFCSHYEAEANAIIRHMAGTHAEQYFACINCHTRFLSSVELAEHKTKQCETKMPYRNRLRQKISTSKDNFGNDTKVFSDGHGFNGVVISCELKPSQVGDGADIEDNITTNLILPPSKNLGGSAVEKNAVIVLDDIQWNKRIPPNFSFHNTDADQILSRLGVVHRSPRTGESTKKDWKNLDESTQKFEKCFDTSFYSKVASNVQENMGKFLDGSCNFNPDPDTTIKTRKSKNSVLINTAEGFPILLASEQYSRNAFDRYSPRAIAPKHKWKWDSLDNDKGPINPDQIKRDSHTNNCIISLVSSLDIWTQLRMRSKYEEKFGCQPLAKKTEKQMVISNELKEILESRELPTPSTQVMKLTKKRNEKVTGNELTSCLGLVPSTSTYELQPAVLSGEWVRPRCYVCCACGAQSSDSRAASAHVASQHPNAQVQHYEIVGEQLLNADILKHLYVPPSQMCNRTRPPRGFRECTKCRKSVTLEDLHQHMLDCAGDTPAVRRKCRYRPFGVRKRRPRLQDISIRKKIRSRQRPKSLLRPRPIRTEVGDAETIRKMIADLPAKRHRVLINPDNPSLRPRIKQRPKILMKRRTSEDRNKQKKRNDKEISQTRLGSPVNDGMSVMSDEDNKPLKPLVRRAGSKISTHRSESDKCKTTMLNRAKRPNRQIKKVVKDESVKDTIKSSCSSIPLITESVSVENSSNKIDINTENIKGKEQASQGQGSSNNRDGQRPGCSGQNDQAQNRCAPAQNVPLKHSIARLTADSEKHDKSVQFHHLFLVQQECNNVNQHIQSGQQLLFENEAAVLTLDKPPLHYNTKGSLDALQKSKLNKPRKGLNACIAMLKNKLVEPSAESVLPAGHVSVQCGDDEPLYIKPDTALPPPIGVRTDPGTHGPIEYNLSEIDHIQQSVNHDIKGLECTKDKDLKTRLSSDENIEMQHYVDHNVKSLETTKHVGHKKPSISGEVIGFQHSLDHDKDNNGKALKEPLTAGKVIGIQHSVDNDKIILVHTIDKVLKAPSPSGEVGIQHSVDNDKIMLEHTIDKVLKAPSTSGEVRIQHSVDNDKIMLVHTIDKVLKAPSTSGEVGIQHSVHNDKIMLEHTIDKVLKAPSTSGEVGIQHSVNNDKIMLEHTIDKVLKAPSTSGEVAIQHSVDNDKIMLEHTIDKVVKAPSTSGEVGIQHSVDRNIKRWEYTKDKTFKTPSFSGEDTEIQHSVDHNVKRVEHQKDKFLKALPTSSEVIGIQHSDDHNYKRLEYAKNKHLKTPSTSGEVIGIEHSVHHVKKRSERTKEKPLKTSGGLIVIQDCVDHNNKRSEYTKDNASKTPSFSVELMTSWKPNLIKATHELDSRRSLMKEDKSNSSQHHIRSQKDVTNLIHPRCESIASKAVPVSVHALPQKEKKEEVKKTNIESNKTKRRTKVKDSPKDIPYVKANKNVHETQPLSSLSIVENKSYDTLNKHTSEEKQMLPEHPKLNPIIHTTVTKENDASVIEQDNNVYFGSFETQADYHAECEYSRNVNMDNFPTPNFNHVPVNNRPAHASTHVESIVSIPLDLSGKVSNVNPTQDLLNQSYLLGNAFDSYETLDLSNKNHNVGLNDEIVDLSIKTSHLKTIENDITANDDVTDLSLKSCPSRDIPTDLTVKKRIVNITTNPLVEIAQQKEVLSLDKTPKPQLEDEIKEIVPTNTNKLDKHPGDVILHVDAEDANLIRNATNTKDVNSISLKPENLVTVTPEKSSEKINECVPADLCQQKDEIISKDLSAPVHAATPKIEQDPYINQENVQIQHSRLGDKISLQGQKPIYDPTLKIPQYKIRAAACLDNPSSVGVTPNTSSRINTTSSSTIPSVSTNQQRIINSGLTENRTQGVCNLTSGPAHPIGIQDQLPYAHGTVPLNDPQSSPGSVYGIANCGITSHINKFESTTPVYTLATACISVTKIESSNSSTLTNALLSIPGSTIANTTPVYTLAGTTIGVPANYSHIVPAIPSNSEVNTIEEPIIPGSNMQNKTQHEKKDSNQKEILNVNSMANADQDPETARKIALLPKELVDVLGNMPVDHRNRLLNILPQYVSTPTTDSSSNCEGLNQSELSVNLSTPSEPKESKMPKVLESSRVSEAKIVTEDENKMLHISNTVTQFNLENTPVMPILSVHAPTLSLHRSVNPDDSTSDTSYTSQLQRNAKDEIKIEVQIKPDVISEDPFSALASNRLSTCHNTSSDNVIDLTEEETVCRGDLPIEPTVEVPPISLIVQPKRNKSNNDQTASLRAVRIKAPSERQKSVDSQLVTYTSVAPVLPNKIHTNEQDNEVEKSLHINVSLNTDMSLAIQQAEVSSTQHSNKNVTLECKFPSVISPNVRENPEETNNCSLRRLSTASKDESVQNEDSQSIKSGVKTTLVTSSILNNEISNKGKEASKVIDKNMSLDTDILDTKLISNAHDMTLESSDLTENNSTSLTDSDIQSRLDVSELSDVPVQCSTPNSKTKDGLLNSTESHLPNASEDHEDSDDDLSLAAICKQKQQNLKTDLNNDVNKSMKCSEAKKKEKKDKKNVENINTARVSSLSNNNTVISIALSSDQGNELSSKCLVDEKQQISPDTNESMKKNNRKLRRKKVAHSLQSTACDMVPKVVLTDCDTHNVTIKNIEIQITEIVKVDSSYNTVLKDDNNQPISSSRKRFKLNDDIGVTEVIKEQTLDGKSSALNEKPKNKKKKTPIEHKETGNNGKTQLTLNQAEKNTETSTISNNNKNVLSDHATSSSVCQIQSSDSLIEKLPIISDDSLNSKGTNYEEHVTPLVANAALTPCSSLEETTPLRRSKRGRSRNNSVTGEESLHTEVLQENRTPLTKKQLIFSKLLLDEENNIRNPDGTTDEKVENLRNSPVKQTIRDVIKEPENIIQEKNKCVKRKKSPHFKRKLKKKKSLSIQSHCEDSVDGLQDPDSITDVINPQEIQNKIPKSSEPTAEKTINNSSKSNVINEMIDMQVSIEKRKSNELPHVEFSHMPKKSRLNVTECRSETNTLHSDSEEKAVLKEGDIMSAKPNECILDDTMKKTSQNEKNTCKVTTKTNPISEKSTRLKLNQSDLRTKTCYNMPVAGRRTRSKSAVIKSAVYDPYDIDMDDMIEQAEPLRQRKTSSDCKQIVSHNVKKTSKEMQNVSTSKEEDKEIISKNLDPTITSLDSYSKQDLSDSDDSSKSDIPLKKYVEEKEKKVSGLNECVRINKKNITGKVDKDVVNDKDKKQSTIHDKKNRRTLGVCNSGDAIAQDETEQQLRSEQFMASFGFFSERKPRKSNLLATKKISETFHIIANETDDTYFNYKGRNSKKSGQNENRKSIGLNKTRRSLLAKRKSKRRKRRKNYRPPGYCHICKKEYHRVDNVLRHQMTLVHVSKLSEVEMRIKTVPVPEEPNYLIAYQAHLKRLKAIADKLKRRKRKMKSKTKSKIKSKSKPIPKIVPLTVEETIAEVHNLLREQHHYHRGLSCDQELFLDCCELLKESYLIPEPFPELPYHHVNSGILFSSEPSNVGLDLLGKTDIDAKCDNINDGDVDSITAKTILESEEVRNLENDLISGLKEAAKTNSLKKSGIIFREHTVNEVAGHQHDYNDKLSSPPVAGYEQLKNYEEPAELNTNKNKKYPEFKEKMYPDIEEIDMFEDKFDKIKRKCRSQAAAAKQQQFVVGPSISRNKGRKKTEKKKGKKNSKQNHPSTVLTKGALKGFDGIKVSIPTTDINMSAIVSPLESSHKRKKKSNAKKRRENKISESSSKYDSDHHLTENSATLKNVDVYEFMDNEDVELFEFRPSTLMERFKSISNKDIPSTSKSKVVVEEPDHSSTSASDGDDFVYMSDDYVCSDDETENSLMSCDVSNTKISTDNKKLSSLIKKRDAIEKNAVMGKIFKNNAVRTEKKITKNKEPAKPKANLDQLFDSLLEDEPSSSMLNDESLVLNEDTPSTSKYVKHIASPSRSNEMSTKFDLYNSKKKYNNLITDKEKYSTKYKNLSSDNDDEDDDEEDDDDDDEVDDAGRRGSSYTDYGQSTSKLCLKSFMGDHKSTKPDLRPSLSPPELKPLSPKKYDHTASKQQSYKNNGKKSLHEDDYLDFQARNSKITGTKKSDSKLDRSPISKISDGANISSDYNDMANQSFDETGVARQRARRKCTVGKQNILAETWSSESEPDGGPPRPNSAESMAAGTTRKKKGKKKDSQHTGSRRTTNNRHISFKKQEIESRVTSSRNTTTHTIGASSIGVADNRNNNKALGSSTSDRDEPSSSAAGISGSKFVNELLATPSTSSADSPMPSTSACSTMTGCATSDPEDGTFLVPAEPGSSSGSNRHRSLYYWPGKDGMETQAREHVARDEQARQEVARREKEREERSRDEDAQQQQQQQHGWIVGDSHKKLVTMLAHAKGRKRNNNNDDKRHKTE